MRILLHPYMVGSQDVDYWLHLLVTAPFPSEHHLNRGHCSLTTIITYGFIGVALLSPDDAVAEMGSKGLTWYQLVLTSHKAWKCCSMNKATLT